MKITVSDPTKIFEMHFSASDNNRILFSGKFGAGKTYFLNEYFDSKKEEINTFWLSPVKYSVSLNEDIFEYIKFDLALKLISMPEFANQVKMKFGEDLYLYQYLSDKPIVAIDTLVVLMETIANEAQHGDPNELIAIGITVGAKKIAEKLVNSFKKYKEFKNTIDKASQTESSTFKEYIGNSVLKKGSVFENDLITQTIRSALEICKLQSSKENVLVIDDFDRLDPEHVFRILNVLSVHNDNYNQANKFGFDKIIIVCDYNNISNIYAHKYGSNINFVGYISKFYSTEVFHFDNNSAIRNFCQNELSDIINDKNVQDVLGLMLSYFVSIKILNIRDIIKIKIPNKFESFLLGPFNIWDTPDRFRGYHEKRYYNNEKFIKEGINDMYISSDDLPLLKAVRILLIVFGSFKNLRDSLELSDSKEKYEKEYVPKVIKSFLTTSHLMRNYREPGFLSFYFQGDTHQFTLTINKPKAILFGVNIDVYTGWSSKNMYDGSVSYYHNVSSVIESFKYDSEIEKINVTFNVLLLELKLILDFLSSTRFLQELGVTKD